MSYDVEFSKFLLHIFKNIVRSTAKSTYFKELLFPFFKIFYTLIVHYVINFVFSIRKQPYRDVINFVSYIHVVYSYNDKNKKNKNEFITITETMMEIIHY